MGDLGRNRSPRPPVSAWQREAFEAKSILWGVQVTAKAEAREGRGRREGVSAPASVGVGCWPHSSPTPEMLQLCVLGRRRSPSLRHRATPGAASLQPLLHGRLQMQRRVPWVRKLIWGKIPGEQLPEPSGARLERLREGEGEATRGLRCRWL